MSKKILLMAGHSRSVSKWGMVGEVVRRLLDEPENEVYYLDCNNNVKGLCGLNASKHWGYCKKCSPVVLTIVKAAGLQEDRILKMEKFKSPEFPGFSSIKQAIDFSFEGYNYGLGPVSCIMTLTRDYNFDIKKWHKTLVRYFETQYTVFKNIEKYHQMYNFDEIHTFNGRMPVIYPCVSFAQKHNIPYVVYERGANISKLRIIPNSVPHDFDYVKKEWGKPHKAENTGLAEKWFNDRRAGKYQAMESYTKDQIKGYLPENFDFGKQNFVFFNSSIDEVYAFPSWKHPFADTENEIIEAMLEHYKNDNSKHFYLRVHPNLTKAKKKKTTQIREINDFKRRFNNLTVIEPDEKVDTYALMDACDKVLTTYSTTGLEAAYWGNVSIIAGKALYEDMDCVYQAKTLQEFFDLIDDKTLKPKPKDNTLGFGYSLQTFGEDYKYFKVKTHHEGEIFGLKLKEKR